MTELTAGTMATGTAGSISILTASDATDSLELISAALEQVAETAPSTARCRTDWNTRSRT